MQPVKTMNDILSVGERVIIHKPENIDESPTWVVPDMDEYDCADAEIVEYRHDDDVILSLVKTGERIHWTFSSRWLEIANYNANENEAITDSAISFFGF